MPKASQEVAKGKPRRGKAGVFKPAIGMRDFERPRHQTASIDDRPG
jgi:hypothetical protein